MSTTLLEPTVAPNIEAAPPNRDLSRLVARLTIAAVTAGILWRLVRYVMQFPIWGDEAYVALNFLDRDFWQMTHKLDYNQVAPVVFLWIEWLACRWLGPSELSLHLFPLLAGVAGLLLFWRFCQFTLPPAAASLAVAILAVSYYPVRHATEIKPYSFDLFMAMLLLVPAVHWLRLSVSAAPPADDKPGPIGWLVLLTLATPLAIASSYPAIFIAGGVSLALLPRVWQSPSWQVWGWFLAFNVLMAGTFVAHIKLVGGEQLDAKADVDLHAYWKDWFPPLDEPLKLPLWLLKAHTGAMMAYPVGSAHGGSTLTFLLCLAGLASLIKTRQRALITLCLAPAALSLLAAFAHRYPYGGSARLAQHLAPAICLLMACGIVELLRTVGSGHWAVGRGQCAAGGGQSKPGRLPTAHCPLPTVHILAGLLCIAVCGLAWNVYRPFKMPGDQQIRQMLQEVAGKAQPTDTIVVFEHADNLRANMIWYLRRTELPIVWQGKADWPTLAAGRHGVWGFSVHGEKRPKMTAQDLLPHASSWTLVEECERTFDKDSIDVPRQDCEVFHWVPR